MKCPRCKSTYYCKDGFAKGRQRYKCKNKVCGLHYTVVEKSTLKNVQIKRMALILYLEGFTYREIGEQLSISYSVISKWVNGWMNELPVIKSTEKTGLVDWQDIQAYFEKTGNRKKTFLLINIKDAISQSDS